MASGEIKVVMEFPGLEELQRTLDELLEEPTTVERLQQLDELGRLRSEISAAHRRVQALEQREDLPPGTILTAEEQPHSCDGALSGVMAEVRRARDDMATLMGRMSTLERHADKAIVELEKWTQGRLHQHSMERDVLRKRVDDLERKLDQVARTEVQARTTAAYRMDSIDARYAQLYDELRKRVDSMVEHRKATEESTAEEIRSLRAGQAALEDIVERHEAEGSDIHRRFVDLVKERRVTREKREAELDKLRQHLRRLTLYHNQHLHEKPRSQAYTFAPTCTVSEDV